MKLDLYKKIIREYSEMGGGAIILTPIVGEFFLDKYCLERLETARQFHNIGMISLTSNGISLDATGKENWNYIIKNTDFIQFSIGGTSKESYKEMYGVDEFEKVTTNIKEFALLRNKIRPEYPLRLLFRVADKSKIKKNDIMEYKKLGYEIIIDNVYGNWGGLITEHDLPSGAILKANKEVHNKRNPCFVFYIGPAITSSGLVSACGCMNSECVELIVGDCNKQSLQKIWNNEEYGKIKASFGTRSMPEVCKQCTQYMDGVEYSLSLKALFYREGRYPFGY